MKHTVRQGDCLESIADQYGFLPETIWEHPDNLHLHKKGNMYTLQPGDVVTIPDKGEKTVSVATDAKWQFRRKGVPSRFRINLVIDGGVVSGAAYTLEIDNTPLPPVVYKGVTGGNGEIDHWMSPDAKQAALSVGEHELTFLLGTVDPVDTERGLVQRLHSLGFLDPTDLGGEDFQEELEAAIYSFQESRGLNATGKPDQETRDALVQAYGS